MPELTLKTLAAVLDKADPTRHYNYEMRETSDSLLSDLSVQGVEYVDHNTETYVFFVPIGYRQRMLNLIDGIS